MFSLIRTRSQNFFGFGPKTKASILTAFDKKCAVFGGAATGISVNDLTTVVTTTARKVNVLVISSKSHISSLGNPKWWVRYDYPHKNVNWPHININRAVSGKPDPHTPISYTELKVAGFLGKIFEFLGKYGFVLAIVMVVIDTRHLIKVFKQGDKRRFAEKAGSILGRWVCGYFGSFISSHAGNLLYPGLGGLVGSIAGGVAGGIFGMLWGLKLGRSIHKTRILFVLALRFVRKYFTKRFWSRKISFGNKKKIV